jgi:hypothetical protein
LLGESLHNPETEHNMKNAPSIIALSTIAALVILAAACSLGLPVSFTLVASYLVGFASAAGTVAFLVADYGSSAPLLAAYPMREAKVARVPAQRSLDRSVPESLMAAFGSYNDPATLTIQ